MLSIFSTRTLPIALALAFGGGTTYAQNNSANVDHNAVLARCVNQAVAAGANTLAAVKSACSEQYSALQNSLPENVRAGTMASLDQMLADRAAGSTPSN